MVETSQHRFVFYLLRRKNLAIDFLQKPETTYVAVVCIDRHSVLVTSVKLKTRVQLYREYFVKDTDWVNETRAAFEKV